MTEFSDIAFTPTTLALQQRKGSRGLYPNTVGKGPGQPHTLTFDEERMIRTRDSFYLASVSETGWPYVQHRGGDAGFVKLIDDHTIGWLERNGNRQYIGTGNITDNGRVAAIFVDYPSRSRLKAYGLGVYQPDPSDDLLVALGGDGLRNDGAIIIELLATDWNCPKYINPRFTEAEVAQVTDPLRSRIAELEARLAGGSPRQRS